MSNDRLYIVCKGCGASMMAGKYWAEPGLQMTVSDEELRRFISEHTTMCTHHGEEELFSNPSVVTFYNEDMYLEAKREGKIVDDRRVQDWVDDDDGSYEIYFGYEVSEDVREKREKRIKADIEAAQRQRFVREYLREKNEPTYFKAARQSFAQKFGRERYPLSLSPREFWDRAAEDIERRKDDE